MTTYTIDELVYMLEGDTTVYRGLLLDNDNVVKAINDTIKGKMDYDTLLNKAYEEF